MKTEMFEQLLGNLDFPVYVFAKIVWWQLKKKEREREKFKKITQGIHTTTGTTTTTSTTESFSQKIRHDEFSKQLRNKG